jgi:hypothetical protein
MKTSAYIRTTKSTTELHNALYNIAQNIWHMHTFLGAFAKLRQAAINFVMSVRPSALTEQLGSH